MKIVNENNGSRNCMVIPLMNIEEFKTTDYYKLLKDNNLVDFMFVEDGSPGFHFSKSMNRGIERCLELDYEFITLSTNNISFSEQDKTFFISYMINMKELPNLPKNTYYVMKMVNGNPNRNILTFSAIKYLFNGIVSKYPFFTLKRYWQMKKEKVPNMYVTRTSLQSGFYGVMPFSIFSADLLRTYKFDENIKNCLEDTDLSYRLYNDEISIYIIPLDVIHKGNASFKKLNQWNKLSGYYNHDDYKNNLIYMYHKYYGNLIGYGVNK